MEGRGTGWRAGRRRAVGLVQLATGISGFGDGLVLAAFPLLAAHLTDDPRLVVSVTIAARLPWLLVALPAGALVDRADRRRLIAGTEACRAAMLLLLAVLVVTDTVAMAGLIATAFVIGCGETVVLSAVHAVMPELVEPERLARTNGSLFAIQTSTEGLIGPALGGLLFAVAMALPFVIDGISFALAAVLLALAFSATTRKLPDPDAPRFRDDVMEGLRVFLRTPVLRHLGTLIAILAFCEGMVFGPLVLFALDGLGLSDTGYGVLLAVAAIGSVAGGAVAGRLDQRYGARVLLPAVALLEAGAYAVCGLATNMAIAAVALGVVAVAVALANVTSLTLRQRIIPNELLGRVGNVMRLFIFGAVPLGALAGGALVEHFGVRAPFAGAVVVLGGALATVVTPLVRSLPAPATTGT